MNIFRGMILFWNRLWVRKDESHKSLDIDYEVMSKLQGEDLIKYRKDVVRRRAIAHNRDLLREN